MNNTIKVCIITTAHTAHDSRIYYKEALSLKKAGYNIIIIAPGEKDEKTDGIEIKSIRPYSGKVDRIFSTFRIYKIAKDINADIYHFHDPDFIFWGARLQKIMKRPVIYDIHENYPLAFKSRSYIPGILKPVLSLGIDLVERHYAKKMAGIIGVYRDRLDTLAPNHRFKLFLPNYPSSKYFKNMTIIEKDYNRMIYVGGLSRERGEDVIINTMQSLREFGSNLYLDIVGWFDNMTEELKFLSVLEKYNIDNIHYYGRVEYSKLSGMMKSATIGLIPWLPTVQHKTAANPNKLFEYMASSILTVAPKFGIFEKILEDSTMGYLYDPDQTDTLTQLLIKIEGDKRQISGKLNLIRKKFEELYSWETIEKEFLGWYDSVINST